MDQIGRIRFKNLIDALLNFCDDASTDEDRAVLLRIGIVVLNKLRIHTNVDPNMGYDVRELTTRMGACTSIELLVFMWDETIELLQGYREELA